MSGKEKIYFLLNRIDDVRAITPSGQPLKIHPMNDLSGNYKGAELTQLFTKLEKDEQILKVLKAPGRIQTIDFVEGIIPDEPVPEHDDGCWYIELLPAFDDYFLNIQHEPEYQNYSNRRPASTPIKSSNGTVMTYEDKLELIVNAVVEAKKATRKGQSTTLYLNSTNGLDSLEKEETRNILLQLQDEGAFKVNPKTNRLLPIHQQPANPGYFLLDDIDNFDSWYEGYLLKQNSKPENLDWLNLLKVLDVCSDIEQQLQITRNTNVTIPSFPYPYIGFSELFPVDTIGTRKSYQQYRWEGAQYLLKEGIALEARYDNDDMLGYGSIIMRVNLVKFYDFYKTIKDEFEKRKESFSEDNKPVITTKVDQPTPKEVNWSDDFRWEDKNFVFGKYGSISFTSDDRRHILKILSDKKGGWATIRELQGNKDAGYVRSTIKQIEDRLPEGTKGHISIVSTQDDESQEKHNVGAYRIKVLP